MRIGYALGLTCAAEESRENPATGKFTRTGSKAAGRDAADFVYLNSAEVLQRSRTSLWAERKQGPASAHSSMEKDEHFIGLRGIIG